MLRTILISATLMLAAPSSAEEAARLPAAESWLRFEAEPPSQSDRCCKICRKGKACGDTCIARDKTCRVGPGCACDG